MSDVLQWSYESLPNLSSKTYSYSQAPLYQRICALSKKGNLKSKPLWFSIAHTQQLPVWRENWNSKTLNIPHCKFVIRWLSILSSEMQLFLSCTFFSSCATIYIGKKKKQETFKAPYTSLVRFSSMFMNCFSPWVLLDIDTVFQNHTPQVCLQV